MRSHPPLFACGYEINCVKMKHKAHHRDLNVSEKSEEPVTETLRIKIERHRTRNQFLPLHWITFKPH